MQNKIHSFASSDLEQNDVALLEQIKDHSHLNNLMPMLTSPKLNAQIRSYVLQM